MKESARLLSVVHAVRFLAKPHRKKSAGYRRIALLLAASSETSIIETIFEDAGLDEFEFIDSLKTAAIGDKDAYRRVIEIAANLAPHLSIPLGPKITAPSVAHEFFLKEIVSPLKPSRYTCNPDKDDFTDAVTAATRREFNDNDFDPRPAVRRLKRHLKAMGRG